MSRSEILTLAGHIGRDNETARVNLKNVGLLARKFTHQRGISREVCQIALGDRFITRSGSAEKRMAASDWSTSECADQKWVVLRRVSRATSS